MHPTLQDIVGAGFVISVNGLPVAVSWWAFLLALLLGLNAYGYIKHMYPRDSKLHYFQAAAIATILTMASLALHEIAHAKVAGWFGIKTVEAAFTGWGAYVVLPDLEKASPWAEMIICLAGPVANFLIAGIAALAVWRYGESLFENTVQYVAVINYRLGKLNLIPLAVLDGGRIFHGALRLVVSGDAAMIATLLLSLALVTYYLFFRKRRGAPAVRKSFEDQLARL